MSLPKVLIVDDEPLARQRLKRVLSARKDVEVGGEAGNVRDAVQLIAQTAPDILFLDVQMPGGDGFDLLDRLKGAAPIVVFVTAFDHHAVRAFDARAADYVLKPIDETRIAAALRKALADLELRDSAERLSELQNLVATLRREIASQVRRARELWIPVRNEYVRLSADAVQRVEAEGDYVRIHAGERSYLYSSTLSAMQQLLGEEDFAQVRRNALVRRDKIASIQASRLGGMVVVLDDGVEVRVGRTYEKRMRSELSQKPS